MIQAYFMAVIGLILVRSALFSSQLQWPSCCIDFHTTAPEANSRSDLYVKAVRDQRERSTRVCPTGIVMHRRAPHIATVVATCRALRDMYDWELA